MVFHAVSTTDFPHPQQLYIADRQTSISFVTNALPSLLQDHHFLSRDDGWISMGTNDQDQTRSEVRFLVRSLSFAPFHVHTIALLDLTVMRLFHPLQHLFELNDNNEDKNQDSDDRRKGSYYRRGAISNVTTWWPINIGNIKDGAIVIECDIELVVRHNECNLEAGRQG